MTKEEILDIIKAEFDVEEFCGHIYDALEQAKAEVPGADEYTVSPLTLRQYLSGLYGAFDHEAIVYWQAVTWFTKTDEKKEEAKLPWQHQEVRV